LKKKVTFSRQFSTRRNTVTLCYVVNGQWKKSMFVCSGYLQIYSETYQKCPNTTDIVLTLDLYENTEKSFVIVVRWEFTFSLKLAVLF